MEVIGDAYFCAAGVPEPCEDHAPRMAQMALGMMECCRLAAEQTGVALQMRVGIHSGPVVAGVVRGDRLRYTLLGDTASDAR